MQIEHHQLEASNSNVCEKDIRDPRTRKNSLVDTSEALCTLCEKSTQEELGPLIEPCPCRKNKYHIVCLQHVLQKKIDKNMEIDKNWETALDCESCSTQMKIHFQTSRKCMTREQVCKSIKRKNCFFGFLVIGLILFVALLGFVCGRLNTTTPETFNEMPVAERALLISGLVLSMVMIGLFVWRLLVGFLVGVQLTLVLNPT